MEAQGSSKSQTEPKKRQSKTRRKPKDSVLEQKSPTEFFAGFANVCFFFYIIVLPFFLDESWNLMVFNLRTRNLNVVVEVEVVSHNFVMNSQCLMNS
ncbi:hypothetical protein FF2_007333 [Malus domestica]